MSECKTTIARFQLRRDAALIWTLTNPVLANGEIGYEADSSRLKIGDGITPWNLLPYFYAGNPVGGILDGGTPDSDYAGEAIIDAGGIV